MYARTFWLSTAQDSRFDYEHMSEILMYEHQHGRLLSETNKYDRQRLMARSKEPYVKSATRFHLLSQANVGDSPEDD